MNQRDDDPKQRHAQPNEPPRKPGPLQLVASVVAAAFGVQSSNNRRRDFTHGKAGAFIAAGIIFTVVFVAVVYGIVSVILTQAGH